MSPDPEIEAIRSRLSKSGIKIMVRRSDHKLSAPTITRISSIIRRGITSPHFSLTMQNLIGFFQCENLIELGTSVGINTLYLARASSTRSIWTFEKNIELNKMAQRIFSKFPELNINLIRGDIDHTLPDFMTRGIPVDFVYFDANHTKEATLNYYWQIKENMAGHIIMVFDDIFWSKGMAEAWHIICRDNKNKLILDLYQMGIIICREDTPSGYYRLAF